MCEEDGADSLAMQGKSSQAAAARAPKASKMSRRLPPPPVRFKPPPDLAHAAHVRASTFEYHPFNSHLSSSYADPPAPARPNSFYISGITINGRLDAVLVSLLVAVLKPFLDPAFIDSFRVFPSGRRVGCVSAVVILKAQVNVTHFVARMRRLRLEFDREPLAFSLAGEAETPEWRRGAGEREVVRV